MPKSLRITRIFAFTGLLVTVPQAALEAVSGHWVDALVCGLLVAVCLSALVVVRREVRQ